MFSYFYFIIFYLVVFIYIYDDDDDGVLEEGYFYQKNFTLTSATWLVIINDIDIFMSYII